MVPTLSSSDLRLENGRVPIYDGELRLRGWAAKLQHVLVPMRADTLHHAHHAQELRGWKTLETIWSLHSGQALN